MSNLFLELKRPYIAIATGLLCLCLSKPTFAQSFSVLQNYPTVASGWDGYSNFGPGNVTITSTGTTASGLYVFAPSPYNPNAQLATSSSYYLAYSYAVGASLNVLGGYVYQAEVNNGQLNLDGGQVDNVDSLFGTVDFNGTTVQAYSGIADTATMESGTVNIVSNAYGQFSMSGGSVDVLDTSGNGQNFVTGGSIGDFVNAFDSSFTTISGGAFGSLNTYDQGIIDLVGSNFTDTLNQDGTYTITGLLQNDPTSFTCLYNDYGDTGTSLEFNGTVATATPAAVPAPQGVVVFGVGLLGFCFNRRKKSHALELTSYLR